MLILSGFEPADIDHKAPCIEARHCLVFGIDKRVGGADCQVDLRIRDVKMPPNGIPRVFRNCQDDVAA